MSGEWNSYEAGWAVLQEHDFLTEEPWAESADIALIGDSLFEMARLKTWETGLPYDLLIDSAGFERKTKPDLARCKIQVGQYLIPILISDNPVILGTIPKHLTIEKSEVIFQWVSERKDTLLKHWYNELSDLEALTRLISNSF